MAASTVTVWLKAASGATDKVKVRICNHILRHASSLSRADARKKCCYLFDKERSHQLSSIRRIEKIQVKVLGPPEDCTLIMNKNVSTPYNCGMHIKEFLLQRSALAKVNGQPWDMHRPLESDCQLEFLHFKDEDPRLVNDVFMRSCSLVLGKVLDDAFNDQCSISLVSFPSPSVVSGSFVYDVSLQLPKPSGKLGQFELQILSHVGAQLQSADLPFEYLVVDASVALELFDHNPHKQRQIPAIAAKSSTGSSVTLYRVGDHIDISRGPMISSTAQISRFTVTAAHDIYCRELGALKRFQGLALPSQLKMHFWTYGLLTQHARHLNPAPLPSLPRLSKTAGSVPPPH